MPIVEVDIPEHNPDSAVVEVLGRAALTAALVADGLEVARPERDAGVDLLAFTINPWLVVPIQMKAATGAVLSIARKYERVDRLVMVYVWKARSVSEVEFYAMTWRQALAIGDRLGWTKTKSWLVDGEYFTSAPGREVQAAIEGHRMTKGRWRSLLIGQD